MIRPFVAVLALVTATPSVALAASRDYSVDSGMHYCEFTIGGKLPTSEHLVRTYRVYPEGPNFHLTYRVYPACGGLSKVAVLLEDEIVGELRIQKAGVCIRAKSGRACVGDTVEDVRRTFPNLAVAVAYEEGPVLTADIAKGIFLAFDDRDLSKWCENELSVRCKQYVKSRRVKEIILRTQH